MTQRYGKSMADVFSVKKSLFEENDTLLNNAKKIEELYRQQPRRMQCKVCTEKVGGGEVYFTNRGTDFFICERCGHLNGAHEDDLDWSKTLYESGLFGDFYRDYDKVKFILRMDTIYMPKVQFLLNSLDRLGVPPDSVKYIEVGAGAGHLTCAQTEWD